MSLRTQCGTLAAVLLLLASIPSLGRAEGAAAAKLTEPRPSSIVIGFVGGFVRHNNPNHGLVQTAAHFQHSLPKDVYVQVFENRYRRRAYQTVLRLLDANRDGVLSGQEKSDAHIILFGHSWGASAAVALARELQRQGIPVLLTVQVDSVAKPWQNDSLIPDNVAEAVNFYQPHGLIHGRQRITAVDSAKTAILGNFRFDYRKNPIQCAAVSWSDRVFTPDHAESECDPQLWTKVEDLVRQRLIAEPTTATANPQP